MKGKENMKKYVSNKSSMELGRNILLESNSSLQEIGSTHEYS
jgi:hypothetical protein